MPAILGIIAFLIVLYILTTYWKIIFSVVAIAGGLWIAYAILKKISDDTAARDATRERKRREEEAARQQHEAQQIYYKDQLVQISSASVGSFEEIPKHLLNAEELLDVAEQDFKEGAFAPFWDSIERALSRLSNLDYNVNLIGSYSKQYAQLTSQYEGTFPPFPVRSDEVSRLRDTSETNGRLQKIVRQAQRNFQFASIYEQRKTNQLLVAGFANLAQALDGLGSRIEASIGDLQNTVSNLSDSIESSHLRIADAISEMSESNRESAEALGNSISNLDSNLQRAFLDQRERQKEALGMLDNIQRRRKPWPPKIGDQAY